MEQRLAHAYDGTFCAQAFNLLVHAISWLQAPARRAATQQQYAEVAALFAAAVNQAANAAGQSTPDAPSTGDSLAATPEAVEPDSLRLQLSFGSGGDSVAVRLLNPEGVTAGSTAAAIDEASIAAVVAAACFLLHKLEELRGDVARARLAMLRGEAWRPVLVVCWHV